MNNENTTPKSNKHDIVAPQTASTFRVCGSTITPMEDATACNPDGSSKHSGFKYIIEPPQGGNMQSVVELNELGMMAIPKDICAKLDIIPKQTITIVQNDDAAILIKGENVYGYDDCEQWVRHIDELCRVVMPLKIRQALNMVALQKLLMYCNANHELVVKTL